MFKLIVWFGMLAVDTLQKLELLALLDQELLVLLEQLLVSGESARILAYSFVEGSLNGADIVFEGNTDKLAAMHTYYLHSTRLLAHVVFLSKDIAFSHFAHENILLPSTFLALYLQLLVDVGFSLHKEEDICKRLSFFN